jgi:hypothetical protein
MSQMPHRPVVQVPALADDRPVWARVGLIALVGFVIGIAWPRLAGVRLGPAPPEDSRSVAALASGASQGSSRPAASGSAPAAASASATPPHSAVASSDTVVVGAGKVLSCRNAKGKPLEECDTPDFETVSGPRLKMLTKCAATKGLDGKLSIGFELDFNRNRIKVLRGKSTTLPAAAVNGVWQCVETEFQKARLDDVTHQHSRYTIFFTVQLGGAARQVESDQAPPAKSEPVDQENAKEPSTGSAQVVYDAVLVRDEPKEGKVIGRLVRGARVDLLSKKGAWYKIRFGDREGWVYRGSIAQ